MKLLLVCTLCLIALPGFSKENVDSLRIAALKEQLPYLSGTKQVDCLNDISREYDSPPPAFKGSPDDSVYKYAVQAQQLSIKLNYQAGHCLALLFIAEYTRQKSGLEKAEPYILKARQIAEKINNPSILGEIIRQQAIKYSWAQKELLEMWLVALEKFQQSNDVENIASMAASIGHLYAWKGNYEKAFTYAELSIENAEKKWNHTLWMKRFFIQQGMIDMAGLYQEAGDYTASLEFLRKADQYAINNNGFNSRMSFIRTFIKMGEADSALSYIKKINTPQPVLTAEAYLIQKNYASAITLLLEAKSKITAKTYSSMSHYVAQVFLDISKAYHGQLQHNLALEYARKSMQANDINPNAAYFMQTCKLLSESFQGLGQYDSAFFYLNKYSALRDTLLNTQFNFKLFYKMSNYKKASEEFKRAIAIAILKKDYALQKQLLKEDELLKIQHENEIKLLDKDNKLKQQQLSEEALFKKQQASLLTLLGKDNKLKDQELQRESFMKKGLFLGLLALLLIGYFIFRSLRLKSKNELLAREQAENELRLQELQSRIKQNELEQLAQELEMQALRAQMNPHFIFNCLSSINRFILKSEVESASDYLTRFSRLIRKVLINSQEAKITLEEELDMLRLYLDMERMRFKDSFSYTISITQDIDPQTISLPPLLLQPFCENSIWHGLMHKQGNGQLDIILSMNNEVLQCKIIDNGVGRQKASLLKSKSAEKEKSLGLQITTNRLALLNGDTGAVNSFEMKDVTDTDGNIAGTTVVLNIKQSPIEKVA